MNTETGAIDSAAESPIVDALVAIFKDDLVAPIIADASGSIKVTFRQFAFISMENAQRLVAIPGVVDAFVEPSPSRLRITIYVSESNDAYKKTRSAAAAGRAKHDESKRRAELIGSELEYAASDPMISRVVGKLPSCVSFVSATHASPIITAKTQHLLLRDAVRLEHAIGDWIESCDVHAGSEIKITVVGATA